MLVPGAFGEGNPDMDFMQPFLVQHFTCYWMSPRGHSVTRRARLRRSGARTPRPLVSVPTRRDDGAMTDDEVLGRARADGFDLIERMSAGQWAVGWARGDDERWPCFLEERQAISWMRDRLSRGRVFV